jgi:release factor glutamine methyltransferase
MKIKEAQTWAIKKLRESQIEQPEISASLLLAEILSVAKSYLMLNPDQLLTDNQEKKYRSWVLRRMKHEPVWYITKHVEFCDQDFVVNKNVLIPRPETEILIELILNQVKNKKLKIKSPMQILDVGTGSGAIILTLAKQFGDYSSNDSEKSSTNNSSHSSSNNKYYASDISDKALQIAKKNADNFNYRTKILFKKGNLFKPWENKKFDYVIANLPYVPSDKMSELSLDILNFEPKIALDGGKNGLEIYQTFLSQATDHLNKNGRIYCEIGDKQGPNMTKMAKQFFPKSQVEVIKDYGGFDRVISIQNS